MIFIKSAEEFFSKMFASDILTKGIVSDQWSMKSEMFASKNERVYFLEMPDVRVSFTYILSLSSKSNKWMLPLYVDV